MFRNYTEDGTPLLTDSTSKICGHFLLDNTSTTVANTLRRCILMETRSVGFRADLTNDTDPGIRIIKNTGAVFNEMLAHRLTLIPLGVRNLAEFDPTRYEFALKAKNETSETVHVTADQFIVREKDENGLFVPLDRLVTAAMFPEDPITRATALVTTLKARWNPDLPADEIDLVAYPVIGRGRDFMGFCPVAQASFENTRDDDPVRQEAFFHEWLASFKKVTEPSTVDPATLDGYRREWLTMAVQRCFRVDEKGQPNSFTFTVESVGIRPVKEIVAEAIKAAVDLVAPYVDAEMPGVSFLPLDSRMSGIRAVFEEQEHTLGNLLEAMIHELYLDTEDPAAPISYAAYKVPHPLQKKMVITLGKHAVSEAIDADIPEGVARQVIAAAAQKARALFEELGRAWSTIDAQGPTAATLEG